MLQQPEDSIPDVAAPAAHSIVTLPETGEALLTARVLSSALGISETSLWCWVKEDESFPRPVRRGERFTRFKLSDARAYIASLQAGQPKPMRALEKQREGVRA
jgi:predicted DNA-binding transcriptional regulator AlpA